MKSPLFPLQYEPELPSDFAERGSEMGVRLAYNTPKFSNQCISQINFVTLHK